MDEEEFVDIKINWLIRNNRSNLIEIFLKQNEEFFFLIVGSNPFGFYKVPLFQTKALFRLLLRREAGPQTHIWASTSVS